MSEAEKIGVADTMRDLVAHERPELEAIFLPIKQMLQIDRVAEIHGTRIVCEMDVTEHWAFPLHFPADPIFPGSLLIEAAGQSVAIWAWYSGLRGKPRLTKVAATFESPLLPQDEVLTLIANVRQRQRVCLGSIDMFAAGRRIGKIEAMLIIVPE